MKGWRDGAGVHPMHRLNISKSQLVSQDFLGHYQVQIPSTSIPVSRSPSSLRPSIPPSLNLSVPPSLSPSIPQSLNPAIANPRLSPS